MFPKHRRGFYVNADKEEVVDATPQAPPLETDDPGVPDEGEYEINLLTEADLASDAHHLNVLDVDANYGVVLKAFGSEMPAQLKLEVPLSAANEEGGSYAAGIGTTELGVKFNFYQDENRGLSMSVYPQLELTPDGSANKGIADRGQTLVLPFLLAHETKYLTVVINAGLRKPFHDEDRVTTTELGLGIGRAMTDKLSLMGEIRSSSSTDFKSDRLVLANAGVIYGLRKAIYYGRLGHSLHSDEGGGHMYVAFGIKVMVDTAKPKSGRP